MATWLAETDVLNLQWAVTNMVRGLSLVMSDTDAAQHVSAEAVRSRFT